MNDLYWDYKKMTRPDDRKLSERRRREEYDERTGTEAFEQEKARLHSLCRGRYYEQPARNEPSPEPVGEAATRSGGARHLDLHCHA